MWVSLKFILHFILATQKFWNSIFLSFIEIFVVTKKMQIFWILLRNLICILLLQQKKNQNSIFLSFIVILVTTRKTKIFWILLQFYFLLYSDSTKISKSKNLSCIEIFVATFNKKNSDFCNLFATEFVFICCNRKNSKLTIS